MSVENKGVAVQERDSLMKKRRKEKNKRRT